METNSNSHHERIFSQSLRVPRDLRTVFWIATLFGAVLIDAETAFAQAVGSKEENKARQLYSFALQTQWPAEAFAAPNANFVVGVLGNDPVFDILAASTNVVQGRRLEARRLADPADASKCQILYVSPSEAKSLPLVIAALKDASVLTVGEGEDFLRKGGMIKFWEERKPSRVRVHFEVKEEAARRAKLNLSSKLLQLSEREPAK